MTSEIVYTCSEYLNIPLAKNISNYGYVLPLLKYK